MNIYTTKAKKLNVPYILFVGRGRYPEVLEKIYWALFDGFDEIKVFARGKWIYKALILGRLALQRFPNLKMSFEIFFEKFVAAPDRLVEIPAVEVVLKRES